MTIGIDEADEFIRWNRTLQKLAAAECACTGDGHLDPCERCLAAELGARTASNLHDLIVGIGAAIRNGLPFSAYETTLLACGETEIIAAIEVYNPSWLEHLLDEADEAVIVGLRGERRLDAELSLLRLVTERERTECLIRGLRRLLKTLPNRGIRRRLRRFVRKIEAFDDLASGTRSLIRINDLRRSMRATIRVRNDWWLYRYDGCVTHPDSAELTPTEAAHVASCRDCRLVVDGIKRLEGGLSGPMLKRLEEAVFGDRP